MRIEDCYRNLKMDFTLAHYNEKRRGKTILKRFFLATLCSLVFLILLSAPILLGLAQGSDYHDDHFNDPTDEFPNDYAPMVIPVNGKGVTVAPVIMCTNLEDGVFEPNHYPCKLAQTLFVDDDWSDKDVNYAYLFEDWTDYDWNDIVVSLYAVTNDIINVEIRLEDREAAWKNPFSVEITSQDLTIDVHWNSTDYPGDHIVRVNPNDTVDIELFAESNPEDTAFITIIPIIPPVASFVYSPLYPQVCEEITFNASASTPDGGYIVSYEWDFGDDSPREFGMVVTHHYSIAGTYNVTLNVTDSEGRWDTESEMITVTPRTYTLTIISTSGGTTDPVPGSHLYSEGTIVSITAFPDTGYIFDYWELDGSNMGDANPISITMDADHVLHAIFKQLYTLTITSTDGGTTNPAPGSYQHPQGTGVIVIAVPDLDYIFDYWELDGVNVSSVTSISVTMNKDHTLHAIFKENPPPPVGGHAIPIDMPHLLTPKIGLTPEIGLASLLLAAMAVTIILIRRRNKTLKTHSPSGE